MAYRPRRYYPCAVRREDIEYFEPLLIEHLDTLVDVLERLAGKNRRAVKVSRRAAIETYLETRSIAATAKRCGVSPTAIRQILTFALRHLRRLAGIRPCGLPSDLIDWPAADPGGDSTRLDDD